VTVEERQEHSFETIFEVELTGPENSMEKE
jgi:hypothetical protein